MKKIFLFLCVVFMAAPTVARAMKCDVEHCNTCAFDNYCKLCDKGWGVSNGKCYELPDHCVDQYATDAGYCSKCENGWAASDGKCYELLEHCVSQRVDYDGIRVIRKCSRCEEGWLPDGTVMNKGEIACFKQTVERCTIKDEFDERREKETGYKQCSGCEDGYGVLFVVSATSQDQQCIPCEDKNAVSCSPTYSISFKCKSGYVNGGDVYHNGLSWCYKEIPYCKEYEHIKTADVPCIGCESGYTLSADGKSCEKGTVCPENATCSGGNVTCNSGYELKNGGCVKITCSANCTACSSSTVCTTCAAGYSLIGGKCVAGTVAQCPSDSSMSSDGCCCIPK